MPTGKAIPRDASPLALLRQQKGYTQRAVAGMLKVSFEYLCRVERGATGVSLRIRQGLAQAYGVSQKTITNLNREAAETIMRAALRRKR